MKMKLINLIVGKNLSRIARVILTAVGAFVLSLPFFDSGGLPLDSSLIDAGAEIQVGRADVEDGLTLLEIAQILAGSALILISRFLSWVRAKNATIANWLGAIIGRSFPSLIRAGLTFTGVWVARFIGSSESPEALASIPLVEILALILPIIVGNIFSTVEDGDRNPKPLLS